MSNFLFLPGVVDLAGNVCVRRATGADCDQYFLIRKPRGIGCEGVREKKKKKTKTTKKKHDVEDTRKRERDRDRENARRRRSPIWFAVEDHS